ncbi:DUF4921 family protein [Corynebacterium uterequi]|uniref:DUF4921 domain-containing protein n=1 Tax=Corynebacterium uterequi TaxID=1072256 RepID=A0A0G3HDE8_9CORY|nr:DUF4921 family protein [Corynebacterium uterequi]AKK11406.1 hypothetical protein CUTER_07085 [Corynebacterium uterequi]
MTINGLHLPAPLTTMSDGTIKQLNPFSGTEVWSVPGRGNRPLSKPKDNPAPLTHSGPEDYCAFCEARPLATPPEKSRITARGDILYGVIPEALDHSTAEFRRVPNLFEIVSYDYWRRNYGYKPDIETRKRMHGYLTAEGGLEHVDAIVNTRMKAAGRNPEELTEEEREHFREAYFSGSHDVLVARRHFVDGATHDDQLASSGTLSVAEHRLFIRHAVNSMFDLYERNPYVRYVSVFQNWLSAAGASFDHLHKQLVGIDSRGVHAEEEIQRLRGNLNMYNELGVDFAAQNNLIIAENDHAVMVVGVGHRFPTVSVYSTSATCRPWEQSYEEIDAMSDLIHAGHAATGPDVACNEEWHHQAIDLDLPMPWRINIKWRVSTLAGFEGGTKIYVNTLTPFDTRDRVVSALYRLRDEGVIDPSIRIATECSLAPNRLLYNPILSSRTTRL